MLTPLRHPRVTHVKSSFPLAVGTEISACDNDCYSSTGKSFSFISLPNSESSVEKTIQEDDISLAYEFANKFVRWPLVSNLPLRRPSSAAHPRPRALVRSRATPPSQLLSVPSPLQFASLTFPCYLRSNLSEKGIHEVQARRFVLVSADHPIVSAISECVLLNMQL